MEVLSSELKRPVVTRGLRREQAKRARRRALVDRSTLVVGLDLAREKQAASFVAAGGEIVGRLRFECAPQELTCVLGDGRRRAQPCYCCSASCLRMRSLSRVSTANAPVISEPCAATAAETRSAFSSRESPSMRTSRTPV